MKDTLLSLFKICRGLTSSSGNGLQDLGIELDLEKVPSREENMTLMR